LRLIVGIIFYNHVPGRFILHKRYPLMVIMNVTVFTVWFECIKYFHWWW